MNTDCSTFELAKVIRIASKYVNKLRSESVGFRLTPTQYGVGIRGSCEFVTHTVANWIEEIKLNPNSDKFVIRLDKKNAFNSIPRAAIRRCILKISRNFVVF